MPNRNLPFINILVALSLGSPIIAGCGFQSKMIEETSHLDGNTISNYSKTAKINPRDAVAYYNRGLAKGELEDYQGAISDFSKAIEIDPRDAVAYHNRGATIFELGDRNNACLDLKKAASLGSIPSMQWLMSAGGAWCRNI